MIPALANPITPRSTPGAQIADHSLSAVDSAPAPNRCFDAPAPFAIWHLTSLDAPTVAVVWALAFARAASVPLPPWAPILLALVAWPVYIADRLLDVRSALRAAQARSLRLRHHFHWRHRRVFIPLAAVSACAAAWIVVVCMPVAARERNSVLLVAGLAYFSSVHAGRTFPRFVSRLMTPFLAKETLVAVIFTAACALPTLSRAASESSMHSGSPFWTLIPAIAYFTLLAWLNCHSIEQWERDQIVIRDRPTSGSGTFRQAIGLGVAGLLLASALSSHQRIAILIATGAAAAFLLALLDRLRGRLTPLALRVAADLVLLTPLPFLLR